MSFERRRVCRQSGRLELCRTLHRLYHITSHTTTAITVTTRILCHMLVQEILQIVTNLITPRALFSPTYLLNLVKLY